MQFNPNYQTYVLYSDGGPADNVKKKKFRKKMPIDADDEFEAHDASEGRATASQKKHTVAFDVERGTGESDTTSYTYDVVRCALLFQVPIVHSRLEGMACQTLQLYDDDT